MKFTIGHLGYINHDNSGSILFCERLSIHYQLEILLCVANNVSGRMLFDTLYVGGTAFVACVYIFMKLKQFIPTLYWFGAGVYEIVFLVGIPIIYYIGVKPYQNFNAFKYLCKEYLATKVPRMQIVFYQYVA